MKRILLALAMVFSVAHARADEAAATAAYQAKQYHRCSELWMEVARQKQGDQVAAPLYEVACCAALDHQTDQAFAALERARVAGLRIVEHAEEDPDLVSLHGDPRWGRLLAGLRANAEAWEKSSFGDAKLRRELLALAKVDSDARMAAIESKFKDQKAMAKVRELDRISTARLKEIVAQHGWPGFHLVGKDGANAAWLLAQHADRDLAFQKLCLTKMEQAVKNGDADASDWAYLVDRIAVSEHRKQTYGTQFVGQNPSPIEDEPHVDQRRKAVGLPTMEEYRKSMQETYGGK
jgi:hypothetical protein